MPRPGGVNRRGFDGVVVEAPDDVADGALVVHDHGKMQRAGRGENIVGANGWWPYYAAAEFAGGRAERESGSKQVASLSASALLLKASEHECIAVSISAISDSSEELGCATASRATLGFRSMVTPRRSRRSTPRMPSSGAPQSFGNRGEMDRGETDAAQSVIAERKFVDGNFARFQRRDFVPGLHADLGSVALREGFFVEHGSGGGGDQEALVLLVHLQDDNGKGIAALQRNLVEVGAGCSCARLRARGERGERRDRGAGANAR